MEIFRVCALHLTPSCYQ